MNQTNNQTTTFKQLINITLENIINKTALINFYYINKDVSLCLELIKDLNSNENPEFVCDNGFYYYKNRKIRIRTKNITKEKLLDFYVRVIIDNVREYIDFKTFNN